MKKWKVIFKGEIGGGSKTVPSDRPYEAAMKAAVLLGYGGYPAAYIMSQVKSNKIVSGRGKAGRPIGSKWMSERSWEKEMGIE